MFHFSQFFSLSLFLSQKPRKCHFWCFYGSNWATKMSFWKQFFPTIFKHLKRIFVSKPDALLYFRFKIWRVVKMLIQNLINFSKFLKQRRLFFRKKTLVQNLTCFEKLDRKCEVARRIWLKKCTVFHKKLSESRFARKH